MGCPRTRTTSCGGLPCTKLKTKRVIITVLIGVVGCWLTAAFNEFAKTDDPDESEVFAILASVFSVIGKFGIAGTFNIVFIHASELYPTPVRSIGVGIANAAGRFGGTLAPIVNAAAGNMSYLPMVIFGALGAFQDRI